MVATLCLLGCALLPAQPAERPEWLLTPRLGRGQELVYSGTYSEEVIGQGVQFNRSYRLETTVFVLDALGSTREAALLTVLQLRSPSPARASEAPGAGSSVRLEVARIDPHGRVEAPGGTPFLVPLDGPPTAESGLFVDVPLTRVGRDSTWESGERGRPPRTWRVTGIEPVNTTRCLKLVGRQQSDDWDRPRGDTTAWRRRDTVWLAPALGVAYRVERVIERREPARKEPTLRSVLRYELLSQLTYPGKLYEDRQREIVQASRFAAEAAAYLRSPGQYEAQILALVRRIDNYADSQLPVEPYRRAVLQVKRRLEAERRGELAPEPAAGESARAAAVAVADLGQRAPDFVATALTREGSVRLRHLLGKPVLLIFYNPAFPTAGEVLRFAAAQGRRGVTVLGLAVSDDVGAVCKQHAELRLKFPVVSGKGFSMTYGVDATPRLVVLDAEGVVRGTYTGWGADTAREVAGELGQWLHAQSGR
jgi:peroxiredoxin